MEQEKAAQMIEETQSKTLSNPIKWNTLKLPKNHGGLGIRDLSTMNKACLMKPVWGVKTDPDRLWHRVLEGKYGRGTLASGTLQVKVNDSPLWKAIHNCWRDINSIEACALVEDTWKTVWKLQAPERIRCFIWQILHGKLATKEYYGKWGNGDLICPLCSHNIKSIMHVLRDCSSAMSLWNSFIPPNLRVNFYSAGFDQWLLTNLTNSLVIDVSLQWCDVWATSCYFLWISRNKQVHDDEFVRPLHPGRIILQQVRDYATKCGSLSTMQQRSPHQVDVCWKAPSSGWVVLNTDGAVKMDIRLASCGGVLRDSHGGWLGGFAKRLIVTSAYLVKLWGAIEGITMSMSKGFTSIELQMDSAIIVNCLNGPDTGSIVGRQFVRRIRQLIVTSTVRIVHIYREANKVVDALANMGCTLDDCVVMFSDPPINVKLLVDADVLGVSTPRMICV